MAVSLLFQNQILAFIICILLGAIYYIASSHILTKSVLSDTISLIKNNSNYGISKI